MRRRRFIIRAALILSALTVLLALASIWLEFGVAFKYGAVMFRGGNLSIFWPEWEDIRDGVFSVEFLGETTGTTFELELPTVRKTGVLGGSGWKIRYWGMLVPLWMVFVLITPVAIVLWRRDRHARVGRCRKCGYDLTGNVSGVCPECGKSI